MKQVFKIAENFVLMFLASLDLILFIKLITIFHYKGMLLLCLLFGIFIGIVTFFLTKLDHFITLSKSFTHIIFLKIIDILGLLSLFSIVSPLLCELGNIILIYTGSRNLITPKDYLLSIIFPFLIGIVPIIFKDEKGK